MSQNIELPVIEKKFFWNRKRLSIALFILLFFLCLIAGIICWLALGKIESNAGRLDGTVYTVSSQINAIVQKIFVTPGTEVMKGQELAKLEIRGDRTNYMDSMQEQFSKSQIQERQLSEKLFAAQEEEERYRRIREQKVTEHVRIQLAMRSLSDNNSIQYKKYAAAEKVARQNMEKANEEFEQISKARYAAEKELNRIRTLNKKFAPSFKGASKGESQAIVQAQENVIFSPADGRIMAVNAAPGEIVQTSQPIFIILPATSDTNNNVWATAWFAREAGKGLKLGQAAEVEITDGSKIEGIVEEIYPPQPLPAGYQSNEPRENKQKQLFVSCKIKFPEMNGLESKKFIPGTPIKCIIYTRSLLGFKGW